MSFLTLIGLPGVGQLTCQSACRYCPATLAEAVSRAVPTTLPILVLMGAALLFPAVLHLWRRQPALLSPGT